MEKPVDEAKQTEARKTCPLCGFTNAANDRYPMHGTREECLLASSLRLEKKSS